MQYKDVNVIMYEMLTHDDSLTNNVKEFGWSLENLKLSDTLKI